MPSDVKFTAKPARNSAAPARNAGDASHEPMRLVLPMQTVAKLFPDVDF